MKSNIFEWNWVLYFNYCTTHFVCYIYADKLRLRNVGGSIIICYGQKSNLKNRVLLSGQKVESIHSSP